MLPWHCSSATDLDGFVDGGREEDVQASVRETLHLQDSSGMSVERPETDATGRM